jgi:maltose O-acetyltransferase
MLLNRGYTPGMDNITRRDAGLPYISDDAVFTQQIQTRKIVQELNTADSSDFELLGSIIKRLIPDSAEGIFINPPFHCDYGFHIKTGKNLFINYNCIILDVAQVTIGDNVQIAPNVAIYTAGHPVHPVSRNSKYEYGIPVTIGNNVWIGGNAVICPGVTIGDNAVIGAGSVVTKDIPANSIAAGNACKVIRTITDADKKYYYKNREFDEESWNVIQSMTDGKKNESLL